MNILFVNPDPIIAHIGGIQRVTDILSRELMKMGNVVNFLSTAIKGDENIETCAPQYYLPFDHADEKECIRRYLDLLNYLKPDCIIFQWVDKDVEAYLKSTPKNLKIISVVHSQPFARYGYETKIFRNLNNSGVDLIHRVYRTIGKLTPWPLRIKICDTGRKYYKMLLDHSDRVCLLSEKYRLRIERFIEEIDTSKIAAISNPASFKAESFDFENKENVIIWVGRIHNMEKNVFDFVDVWDLLAREFPDWRAVVAGDGPELTMLKKYASKKTVPRIEFLGRVNNVAELFKKAKIQLITSFCEGLPMVMIEGMVYGVVPVAYNTFEAVEDLINNEYDGLIAKPLDKEDMRRQVSRLINDKSMLSGFAKRGIINVEKFNPQSIAKKWIDLINSIEK